MKNRIISFKAVVLSNRVISIYPRVYGTSIVSVKAVVLNNLELFQYILYRVNETSKRPFRVYEYCTY